MTFLFRSQVLFYGHLVTPRVSQPTFDTFLAEQQRRAVFPMWRVVSSGDLDVSNADNARFIGMVQSWQSHAFQPAWTADWTGALVRYQGLAGSTADLTDTSTLMTLTASGTPLFRLVHDANQVATSSFVPFWPAFDGANLYGLDAGKRYFLEPAPRPVTTHVTSLPTGVRIGEGTIVSSSFAHVELASPVSSSFDFVRSLIAAHAGVRFQGVDTPLGNGAVVYESSIAAGGSTRSGLFVHPPYQGQLGGETFVEYSVAIPPGATLAFSVGVADNASCTDGVTFRVTVAGEELWHQHVTRTGWHDVALSLTGYSGSTALLRLISNPGPASDPYCDWSVWSGVTLSGVRESADVPLALAGGSVVSGFEGDGTLSVTSPLSATVANLLVPGQFTIVTHPGAAVSNGTNLATVPFEVWQAARGKVAAPAGPFDAGSVRPSTSGGVSKTPAIFAHPPDNGRTILSWVVHLPNESPFQLEWSAGLQDGAFSDDGVAFMVLINGIVYWQLTTTANHWNAGALDLTRWRGQDVLIELVTDSRDNFVFDWAYWADLVLSGSSATCSYAVAPGALLDSFGGASTINVNTQTTCPWSAVSQVTWLTISSGSGNGSGAVSYVADPNPGPARQGTLTIAGQTVTVTQAGRGAPFADGPLIAGSSVIRAVHVPELRARIDALRVRMGLPGYSWTDSGLASGAAIRAQHIVELRSAIAQAYAAAGRTPPTYTTSPGLGLIIRVADLADLRAAVVAIE